MLIRELGLQLRQEFIQGMPRLLYAESVVNILSTHLIRHYSNHHLKVEDSHSQLPEHKLQQVID
jgi:hypothetical protein